MAVDLLLSLLRLQVVGRPEAVRGSVPNRCTPLIDSIAADSISLNCADGDRHYSDLAIRIGRGHDHAAELLASALYVRFIQMAIFGPLYLDRRVSPLCKGQHDPRILINVR
ncbi:hypothetical protein [Rhizobium sp. P44RR-XXIV]|uniref:hypothetical protein n=1 Tax=Rhizobium sp. P44RR-XXIV TaxID=1921145 RepID=UPI000984CA6E|nr:hypothetical protein [Rhizobium sp. P44RR-XXIV]TIX89714.1 hypothetical protein BSK43_024600 [Rhizobium sp. P44RR-XXIV]